MKHQDIKTFGNHVIKMLFISIVWRLILNKSLKLVIVWLLVIRLEWFDLNTHRELNKRRNWINLLDKCTKLKYLLLNILEKLASLIYLFTVSNI